jgi:hypothetical protein
MEYQEKGPVKKISKQNNNKRRKGIIAVGAVFVVACAFSYLAGMQQQTGRFSPAFASANSTRYAQGNAQSTANTSSQPTQDNANYAVGNDLAQNGVQANTASQGVIDNGGNTQGGFGDGSSYGARGFEGGYGRHGGGRGRHGNYQSNNSGVTGTYSANVQRCCATGKTGTCHS